VKSRTLLTAVLLSSAVLCGLTALLAAPPNAGAPEPNLPSWNEGASKQAIMEFVGKVTRQEGPDYVPPAKRIAAFDNDGTLWAEQPLSAHLVFALDRVKALSPQHPEWTTTEPFASVLKGDIEGALAGGEPAISQIVTATRAETTTGEFEHAVRDWMATAKHPKTGRLYSEMVYQPMLELLAYLRANEFKTFIVSGGGIDFMRVFSERVYGIPSEQVIGSRGKLKFELKDGKPALVKLADLNFIDDKNGKPVGIQTHIECRPIAAFGNSDDDIQMLQRATTGSGARLGVIVRHTDAEREWAYDVTSSIGKLDAGLDHAQMSGWTVVDMEKDWKVIFLFEKR
jgi:phosphoglycolate phosphatase-like HAD superfamily hydrolase